MLIAITAFFENRLEDILDISVKLKLMDSQSEAEPKLNTANAEDRRLKSQRSRLDALSRQREYGKRQSLREFAGWHSLIEDMRKNPPAIDSKEELTRDIMEEGEIERDTAEVIATAKLKEDIGFFRELSRLNREGRLYAEPTNKSKEFGGLLKDARWFGFNPKTKSQKEIAEIYGFSTAYLTSLEDGQIIPWTITEEEWDKISEAYQLDKDKMKKFLGQELEKPPF